VNLDALNNKIDDVDEVEESLRARLDDVSFLLDEKSIEHETFLNSDGEDGWLALITAGHGVHGSPLREYTITYASRDDDWLWQSTDEDGEDLGPHALGALGGDASPIEIAGHLAQVVGDGRG
jgi:hypothetical protein